MAFQSTLGSINVHDSSNYKTDLRFPVIGQPTLTSDFDAYLKVPGVSPSTYYGRKFEPLEVITWIQCANWTLYASLETQVNAQQFTFSYTRANKPQKSYSIKTAKIHYDEQLYDETGKIRALVVMEADIG